MTSTTPFADRLRTATAAKLGGRTRRRRPVLDTRPASAPEPQGGELFAERLRAALPDRPKRPRVTTFSGL